MTAPCPHPGKARYQTKKLAKTILARHQRCSNRGDMAAYRCVCGWWHLGHKKGSLYRKLKRAGVAR